MATAASYTYLLLEALMSMNMAGLEVAASTSGNAPWEVEWTEDRVSRFWDWWAMKPSAEQHYFARRNGISILRQVRKYTSLSGMIVDLGAGPGYMVEYLLRRKLRVMAVDLSEQSIARLNERFRGRTGFLGARVCSGTSVPVDNGQADVVLLIETVEHLADEVLHGVLDESRRMLRPGGELIVTTPHSENLEKMKVMCPNCACVFHQFQHVRNWTTRSLKEIVEQHGFETVVCKATLYSFLPRLLWPMHHLLYRVLGRAMPHVLYIGRAV